MLHHMPLSSVRCADGEVAALWSKKKGRQKQWSVYISYRNQISESEAGEKGGEERKSGKLGHKKISETH